MARTLIPITTIAELGTSQPSATAGDATNDHYLLSANCIVECKNTSGGALDVTFVTSYQTSGGLTLQDNVITVAAGAIKLVDIHATAANYRQSGDSNRIYVDVMSNSWEFRAYAT